MVVWVGVEGVVLDPLVWVGAEELREAAHGRVQRLGLILLLLVAVAQL